jgi:hypothetical protein
MIEHDVYEIITIKESYDFNNNYYGITRIGLFGPGGKKCLIIVTSLFTIFGKSMRA